MKKHVLAYYLHLRSYPYSLINRILGMFKLTLALADTHAAGPGCGARKHVEYRVIVLAMCHPPSVKPDLVFDLKGALACFFVARSLDLLGARRRAKKGTKGKKKERKKEN